MITLKNQASRAFNMLKSRTKIRNSGKLKILLNGGLRVATKIRNSDKLKILKLKLTVKLNGSTAVNVSTAEKRSFTAEKFRS